MNQVHFTLQGKGGVGKSYVAAILAQHQKGANKDIICVDTDPVNCTFAEYKAFGATRIEIMEGSKINERNFDKLMELIIETDSDIIVDNGSSSFVPLSNYLIENQAIELLQEAGKEIFIHPVITGGQAMLDTLSGFDSLASQFTEHAKIIVWLNEYFGDIQSEGKAFEKMKVYQNHKERVDGIVKIPRINNDTFGQDVELMLKSKLSFDEAISSEDFKMMSKQRLKMVKKNIWSQLDMVVGG